MPAAPPDLFALVRGEPHVGLAVSGGSDSAALMRLAASAGLPKLTALTVDHGLRSDSAAEARVVAGWCAALGVDHHTLTWAGDKLHTGLQAKARVARYDLMTAWCRDHGATVLLTGHTLDDQAETVLMRMARTSSIDSLAGIARVGQWRGLRLFRPLLELRRQALRDRLVELRQGWIDDPSNEDARFERVRIRMVMPVLERAGVPAQALAALAREAQEVTHALWGAAQDWIASHVNEAAEGFGQFPVLAFDRETEVLKTRILGLVICRFGSGRLPEPAELQLLSGWLALEAPSRRTLGGAIIVRRKREILVGREPGRIRDGTRLVPDSGKLTWDGRFEISAPSGSQVVAQASLGNGPRRNGVPAFVSASLPVLIGAGTPAVRRYFSGGDCDWARFRPNRCR